jgi:hypothetical protein
VNQFKEHIVYKFCTVILILALLTPSAVKFFHIFEDHIHEVCKNNQKTHFHEFDLDCEFYKFKLSTQFSGLLQIIDFLTVEDNYQSSLAHYQFINSYIFLDFFLRGPPQLV